MTTIRFRDYERIFQFSRLDGALAPEDLTGLTDEEITELEAQLVAEFDGLYETDGSIDPERLEDLDAIASDLERVRLEAQSRDEVQTEAAERANELADRVHPPDPTDEVTDEGVDTAQTDAPANEPAVEANASAEGSVEEPATESESEDRELVLVAGAVTPAQPRRQRQLNVPLAEVARRAPQVEGVSTPRLSIVAAGDVQGFATGGEIEDLDSAARAMHARARVLSDRSGNVPVLQIKKEFPETLSIDSMPNDIERVIAKATNPDVLVAAGGWCAPSQPMYEFFNVSGTDGMLDVPTVGVNRGGIRWPVSPSIADVMSNIWLWTENDDIDAVTGSGTKACVRVPCPSWLEERLSCNGLCVTNGNLMDSAFPENTRNFLSLMISAHEHVANQRFIADLVSQSTAITGAGTAIGVTAPLLNNIELQTIDYRTKYRMPDSSVLELVLPDFAKGLIRADLARRGGMDELAVSDAQINSWFDVRSVKVQFVSDWQVGSGTGFGQSTPRTSWPQTIQFLLYAAGTFVKGNGLSLDLGVVRDSTLNATNDFTAAWSEECNLIAMLGHESRVVTVSVCPSGEIGNRTTTTCPTA